MLIIENKKRTKISILALIALLSIVLLSGVILSACASEKEPESGFGKLPETIERDIKVEGFTETTTLTKFLFRGVIALYLDADVFEWESGPGAENWGSLIVKEEYQAEGLVPPRIEVDYDSNSNTKEWFESISEQISANPNMGSEELTLGSYPCTLVHSVSGDTYEATYCVDYLDGHIAIKLQYDSGTEFAEGWGARLPQMLDTLVMDEDV